MNTADFSVLSDDLVVSLNPLRRSAHRARAVCTRLVGLAMPWNSSTANVQQRPRVRAVTGPARWPFPPVPVEEGTLTGQTGIIPVAAPAPALAPSAVPQLAPSALIAAAPAWSERSLGNATVEPVSAQVSMKSMVIDVVMVLSWGAIIPALMWLGAAAGF